MLTLGQSLPAFELNAVTADRQFTRIHSGSYPGKWLVLFFWPHDFTVICPTELTEFARLHSEFLDRDAEILGISTDSEYVHLAWREHKAELNQLPYPMLSDTKHELSRALGILDPATGVAQRATFIIDPTGVIRFVMVTDVNVGRNPQEVLRVLDALLTKALCACNWQPGEKTLTVN